MNTAQNGDQVTVHYTMKTADGAVFYTSEGRPALQFRLGSGEIISGFDQAVTGMKVGEIRQVTVPPDLAFGLRRPERVQHLKLGFVLPNDPARARLSTVTESSDTTLTQDYNHPLAGRDLAFEIRLIDITPAQAAGAPRSRNGTDSLTQDVRDAD